MERELTVQDAVRLARLELQFQVRTTEKPSKIIVQAYTKSYFVVVNALRLRGGAAWSGPTTSSCMTPPPA